jgi:PrcB C-terminal
MSRQAIYTLTLIMALVSVGTACGPLPAEEASPKSQLLETHTVDVEPLNGIRRQQNLLIKDTSEWAAVWRELRQGSEETGAAVPQIDFMTQSVIVAALGGRPAGGYRITIEVELTTPTELIVSITEHQPGSNCIMVAIVTYPTAVVAVPVAARTATFRSRTIAEPCH